MRLGHKRFQRVLINRHIAANRSRITKHHNTAPDDFAGREALYIRHYELVEQREALS